MKISLEDAESWYRGDQDQNVSAHQVAVFYRGEYVLLKNALAVEKQRTETFRDSFISKMAELESDLENPYKAEACMIFRDVLKLAKESR